MVSAEVGIKTGFKCPTKSEVTDFASDVEHDYNPVALQLGW